MDTNEAYVVLQDASGLKEGDRVKVLRTAKEHELGWSDCWVQSMDSAVGKEYTVNSINNRNGVRFKERSSSFPFFVLEKISPKLPDSISLGDYECEFLEGGSIKVGCQTIKFDKVKEIYETASKVNDL